MEIDSNFILNGTLVLVFIGMLILAGAVLLNHLEIIVKIISTR